MADDEQKSEARAFLRHFASGLQDREAVDRLIAYDKSDEECARDHTCDFLDAVHTLRDELVAWDDHADHDGVKCPARHRIANYLRTFDKPVDDPALIEEEMSNKLDVVQHLFLHNMDPEITEMVCSLVEAAFVLRDDLIVWGRKISTGGSGTSS